MTLDATQTRLQLAAKLHGEGHSPASIAGETGFTELALSLLLRSPGFTALVSDQRADELIGTPLS